MNLKRYFSRTKRRYLAEITIVRFFLLAQDAHGGEGEGDDFLISEIRKMRYRVLVIDDNDKFRRAFCFKLKRIFNAAVDDVNSGEAAIDKLQTDNYDLIITDIMMPPGMSGIETYHEVRKIEVSTRVVMMSAYSDSDEWKQAQDLHDVTLLHKPFHDAALIDIFNPNRGG